MRRHVGRPQSSVQHQSNTCMRKIPSGTGLAMTKKTKKGSAAHQARASTCICYSESLAEVDEALPHHPLAGILQTHPEKITRLTNPGNMLIIVIADIQVPAKMEKLKSSKPLSLHVHRSCIYKMLHSRMNNAQTTGNAYQPGQAAATALAMLSTDVGFSNIGLDSCGQQSRGRVQNHAFPLEAARS